jgi:hypothetical protein
LERVGEPDRDPITALRETVEAIWKRAALRRPWWAQIVRRQMPYI